VATDRDIALGRTLYRRSHLRLLFSALVGMAVAVVLRDMDVVTRSLIGWDSGAALWLIMLWRMMATTTVSELRLKAAQQDESATVILLVMVAAVTASLVGIVVELSRARQDVHPTAGFVLLPLCTIVLSWLSMHVLFATHYAHLYYMGEADCDTNPGLIFPKNTPAPGYLEFVYFSFCIGMTYQVSDVVTTSRDFRRLITLHGVLSFFYNTFILALAVGLFGTLPGLPSLVTVHAGTGSAICSSNNGSGRINSTAVPPASRRLTVAEPPTCCANAWMRREPIPPLPVDSDCTPRPSSSTVSLSLPPAMGSKLTRITPPRAPTG
jgi:uncharacterized membrane protein